METDSTMQEKEMTSPQQSNQDVHCFKPGEPEWLIRIAESLDEGGVDRMKHQMDDKRENPRPSSQQLQEYVFCPFLKPRMCRDPFPVRTV